MKTRYESLKTKKVTSRDILALKRKSFGLDLFEIYFLKLFYIKNYNMFHVFISKDNKENAELFYESKDAEFFCYQFVYT